MSEQNFLLRLKEAEKKRKRKKATKSVLKTVPFIALVGVLAVSFLLVKSAENEKKEIIREISAYINDPTNIKAYAESEALSRRSMELDRVLGSASEVVEAINSYPLPGSETLDYLVKLGIYYSFTVTVDSYSASNGQISLVAVTDNATDVNAFIKSLNDSGLFADIDYGGYNRQSGKTSYSINLTCILSADVGRSNKTDN